MPSASPNSTRSDASLQVEHSPVTQEVADDGGGLVGGVVGGVACAVLCAIAFWKRDAIQARFLGPRASTVDAPTTGIDMTGTRAPPIEMTESPMHRRRTPASAAEKEIEAGADAASEPPKHPAPELPEGEKAAAAAGVDDQLELQLT